MLEDNMLEDVVTATHNAIRIMRQKLAPHGLVEGEAGGFRAGHLPDSNIYAAGVYRGLTPQEIGELEASLPYPVPEQASARIPDPLKAFYSVSNGLGLYGVQIGGAHWIMTRKVSAPIGLNSFILDTPLFIAKSNFCFGSINGESASQGRLYLTPEGQVHMVHRDAMLIGMIWESLASFLVSETERQLAIHDDAGKLRVGCRHLPGDTADWEQIAALAKGRRT